MLPNQRIIIENILASKAGQKNGLAIKMDLTENGFARKTDLP
jgi:hypothetical protein